VTIGAARPDPAPLSSAAEAALVQLQSDQFVECYRMHYPRLVRALRLAGADLPTAEDLAQEAFARTLARWRRVRRGSSPAGYAYRIGFRLLTRRPAITAALIPDTGPTEPGPEALAVTQVAVEQRLAAMPPRRRACAVLCLVVGLPVTDAARALGIADGTARKHLEEARAELAQWLGD
jgi:RNA polymerase sigma factor (sigma-70 family)